MTIVARCGGFADGGEPHGCGVVRLSDHPDPARGPRLVSDPLDGVVDVVLFGVVLA
jgi:hypothetical protein